MAHKPFPQLKSDEIKFTVVALCLNVSVLVAGVGGYGVETNGNTQEDFDSMEKETLVTKLKQVGLWLQLGFYSMRVIQRRASQQLGVSCCCIGCYREFAQNLSAWGTAVAQLKPCIAGVNFKISEVAPINACGTDGISRLQFAVLLVQVADGQSL